MIFIHFFLEEREREILEENVKTRDQMPRRRKKKWGKKPLRIWKPKEKKPEVDWNKRLRDAVRLNDWKQVIWLVEEKGVKVPLDPVDILNSAINLFQRIECILAKI